MPSTYISIRTAKKQTKQKNNNVVKHWKGQVFTYRRRHRARSALVVVISLRWPVGLSWLLTQDNWSRHCNSLMLRWKESCLLGGQIKQWVWPGATGHTHLKQRQKSIHWAWNKECYFCTGWQARHSLCGLFNSVRSVPDPRPILMWLGMAAWDCLFQNKVFWILSLVCSLLSLEFLCKFLGLPLASFLCFLFLRLDGTRG